MFLLELRTPPVLQSQRDPLDTYTTPDCNKSLYPQEGFSESSSIFQSLKHLSTWFKSRDTDLLLKRTCVEQASTLAAKCTQARSDAGVRTIASSFLVSISCLACLSRLFDRRESTRTFLPFMAWLRTNDDFCLPDRPDPSSTTNANVSGILSIKKGGQKILCFEMVGVANLEFPSLHTCAGGLGVRFGNALDHSIFYFGYSGHAAKP
jgi:hypothetical protein